jgi:hypothetical protein
MWDIEHNPLIPNREKFLQLIPRSEPVPPNGLIPHVDYDFQAVLESVSELHLMAYSHIQAGMLKIWGIFEDSSLLTLLTDGFPETVEPEDFVSRQYLHLDKTTKGFKGSTQETLERVISTTVSENIATIKPKEKQRYSNMIGVTTLMLHTSLVKIIDNTLATYLSLFQRYLPLDKLQGKMMAQFSLILEIDSEKKLNFAPTIPKYKDELVNLVTTLERVVQDLPLISSPLEIDLPKVSFNDCIDNIRNRQPKLNGYLSDLFLVLEDFLAKYRYLESVLALDSVEYTHDFDPNGHKTLDEYRKHLTDFNQVLNIVGNEISQDYLLGIVHLSCKAFKEQNSTHIRELIHNFLAQVKRFALQAIVKLKEGFESIQTRLQTVPQTPEELAQQKKFLENVYETVKVRQKKMAISNERFGFLEEFHFECSNEEFELRYRTLQMPVRISGIMDDTERTLSVERIRMIQELRANQRKMEIESVVIEEEVAAFAQKYTDLEMNIEAYECVQQLDQRLSELKKQQETYNKHEKLFDFEQVPESGLGEGSGRIRTPSRAVDIGL